MKNLFSVQGKVAVVTGGSRGIGKMISEGLVANGVRVYIVSRKSEACKSTAQEIVKKYNGECYPIVADLSNVKEIDSLIGDLTNKENNIDFLINNAGASWGAKLEKHPESGWDKVMDLNVKGLFFFTQKLIPFLKKKATNNDPARVVNIGSIDGMITSNFDNISYGVSKAAVHYLTKILAANLVKENINVNAIAPGPFPTWMLSTGVGFEGKVECVDWSIIGNQNPRSRVGTIEDIVGATIFLCSRAGAYIVGEIITCDGGMVACS